MGLSILFPFISHSVGMASRRSSYRKVWTHSKGSCEASLLFVRDEHSPARRRRNAACAHTGTDPLGANPNRQCDQVRKRAEAANNEGDLNVATISRSKSRDLFGG